MDVLSYANISLMRYIIEIVYPRVNSFLFMIFLIIKYEVEIGRNERYRDANYHKIGLNVNLLPNKLHKKIVKTKLKDCLYDCTHQVIVPHNIFYDLYSENLYFRDGQSLWVNMKVFYNQADFKWIKKNCSYITNIKKILQGELEIKHNEKEEKTKSQKIIEKTVQIVPDNLQNENVAYFSENAYFNVMKCDMFAMKYCKARVKFTPIKTRYYAPLIAEKVIIQMINTPKNIGTDLIDLILEKHFSIPRYMHENDYFAITLKESSMQTLFFKYFDIMRELQVVYFKCKKISNKSIDYCEKLKKIKMNETIGFFVVKGETELIQEQNVHSLIPFNKLLQCNLFLPLDDTIDKFFIENCPYGLVDYIEKIEESVAPFLLEKSVNPMHTEFKCIIAPMFIIRGHKGSGRSLLMSLIAKHNGLQFLSISCQHFTASTAKQTETKIDVFIQNIKQCAPVLVYLEDFHMFAIDRENNEDVRIVDSFIHKFEDLFDNYNKYPILVFAGCDISTELKPNLSRIFLEEFTINLLDRDKRYEIFKWMLISKNIIMCDESFQILETASKINSNHKKSLNKWELGVKLEALIEKISSKTETFVYEDFDTLIYLASINSHMAKAKFLETNPDIVISNENLIREEDFENALEKMRVMRSGKLTNIKVPNVLWEDVGGLDNLKKEIFRTIELPLKFPHLMAKSGLKRSGILLWGPPGCGKTLIARAIASQLKASFLSVKGPELLDMYVGQSEKNMRDIFTTARGSAPCVIFFDEAEAVAGARGAAGDSGGAADRLVSQLLAELDGVASNQKNSQSGVVIVIAATNRPDLVEPALLRPGRLDKLLYVGPYVGEKEKVRVLQASSREYNLCENIKLNDVVKQLPDKCTGADLASIVKCARHIAISQTIEQAEIEGRDATLLTENNVILSQNDFEKALLDFVPSISIDEMNYYESLKYKLN